MRKPHRNGRGLRTLRAALRLLLAASLAAAPVQASEPAFQQCLAQLRATAIDQGIQAGAFDRLTGDLEPDPSVLELLDAQPEFRTPIWDYLAGLVDERRVRDGLAMLEAHAETLVRVEQEYRVDRYTVLAIWGVESDYGRRFGKRPVLRSLATLACAGRRQAFFRGELLALLKLHQAGDLAVDELVGSWAGAFGHTQFMPSTYLRIAVDFDGDGRRDLVDSVPDVLASTARYLHRSGWQPDKPWGYEVRLPAGFRPGTTGRKHRQPLSWWKARGLRHADGRELDDRPTPTALLLPAGQGGPAWLVHKNFDAIFAYNAAESYALAIALLADRLRGAPPAPLTAWPTDDPPLDRDQRERLQRLLLARGHDIGEIDGLIGAKTRRAIAAEQERLGLPGDGRAGERILQELEREAATSIPDA